MNKYLIFEYIFIFISKFIHVIYCEEVPVFSSKLEVIMYGDYGDVEFQMKKRDYNTTPEINPTSTIPIVEEELKVNLEHNFTNNINNNNNNNNNTLLRKEVPDKDRTVPIMAALYLYDKNVVEELRSFLKKENKNISKTHKRVIEKYITEWDDVIHDPNTQEIYQDINHPFPELKTPFFNLPKEIKHMFKLVRMSARVYIELNRIIIMLRELHWKDLVDKLVNYEVNAEIFFQYEDMYQMAFEMLKLTEMYFTRVKNSYPSNLLPKIPISDFVSVGLSSSEDAYLKEPIKWVNLAKQQLFKRSTYENQTKHFYETYLDIVLNYLSFKHDYALKDGNYSLNTNNLFPYPLAKVNIDIQTDNEIAMNSLITNNENTLPTYKQLCNGKDFRSPQNISHLKCYYDNRGAKWLFLMPAKVEILSEDPEVIFFHDVLRDKMINKLLQVALPLQKESGLYNSYLQEDWTNKAVRSSYAVQVNNTIDQTVYEFTLISHYISALETVKETDAELLQVNSYKAGGHYIPHMDSFKRFNYPPGASEDEKNKLYRETYPTGDRIATLLFYLNDVEDGGRTVFTKLGVSVPPEKGGALMWFSLFRSGIEDERLEHAGCPVITGTKSVINKWIRYNSQLFRRPCLLQREHPNDTTQEF